MARTGQLFLNDHNTETHETSLLNVVLRMSHDLCTHAAVHVAIRDEHVQQLLTKANIGQSAVALDRGLDSPLDT